MDEEDGIAGRHAVIEHNEYHVLRELTGGDAQDNSPRARTNAMHFHRPYCTTLTHLAAKEDRDALFTLLRRCLPFREWEYVDTSTTPTYFDPYIYLFKPGEGTESQQDEAFRFHDWKTRFYVEDSRPKQRMRATLRELQWNMFRRRWHDRTYTWWFVLKARALKNRN
jgi:hypothetical protein